MAIAEAETAQVERGAPVGLVYNGFSLVLARGRMTCWPLSCGRGYCPSPRRRGSGGHSELWEAGQKLIMFSHRDAHSALSSFQPRFSWRPSENPLLPGLQHRPP